MEELKKMVVLHSSYLSERLNYICYLYHKKEITEEEYQSLTKWLKDNK